MYPHLSTTVEARGILGSKQHEPWVSLDDFLCLGHKQLPVVVEESVESLQDISGGEVQLIQDDPVTFPHGVDQNAWSRWTSMGEEARVTGNVQLQSVCVCVNQIQRVFCLYSQTKSKNLSCWCNWPLVTSMECFFPMKIHICELSFKILKDKIIENKK